MTSTLSASAQRAIERRANHKLAVLRHVEEVSGNVAASFRYYGVSRLACYAYSSAVPNVGHPNTVRQGRCGSRCWPRCFDFRGRFPRLNRGDPTG
jgi:hypothetical protein